MIEASASPGPKPSVVTWFQVYCWVVAFLYLLVSLAALPFFLLEPAELDMPRETAWVVGAIFLVMGGGLLVLSLLPLFIRPKPWVWTYDLILICLGMTSACFLPACIPLLIFWLRPETKRYFGMRAKSVA